MGQEERAIPTNVIVLHRYFTGAVLLTLLTIGLPFADKAGNMVPLSPTRRRLARFVYCNLSRIQLFVMGYAYP